MDQKAFQNRLIEQTQPVLVYFWAPWCLPCRVLSPAIEKIKEAHADQIFVWKLNADEHPQLLRDLSVYGIPTLVAFKHGAEIDRQTGLMSRGQLETWTHMLLTGSKPKTGGLHMAERLLRIGAGIVLAAAGLFVEPTWVFILVGGVVAFTGIYDRCPIWQAIRARFFDRTGQSPTL